MISANSANSNFNEIWWFYPSKDSDVNDSYVTYNYKDNRVSDHRINLTLKKLDQVLDGDLDEFIDALVSDNEASRLANLDE